MPLHWKIASFVRVSSRGRGDASGICAHTSFLSANKKPGKLFENQCEFCVRSHFCLFVLSPKYSPISPSSNSRGLSDQKPQSTAHLECTGYKTDRHRFRLRQNSKPFFLQQRQNDVSTTCAFEPPRPGERCIVGRDCLRAPSVGKGQGQWKNLCVSALASFYIFAFVRLMLLRPLPHGWLGRAIVTAVPNPSQDREGAWRRGIFVRLPVSR